MYYVLRTEGPDEPWWFFEDWEKSIQTCYGFSTFAQAKAKYIDLYQQLAKQYPKERVKDPYMAAFWQEGEFVYCEDCDDELQKYHGLLILDAREEQQKQSTAVPKTCCPMKQKKGGNTV